MGHQPQSCQSAGAGCLVWVDAEKCKLGTFRCSPATYVCTEVEPGCATWELAESQCEHDWNFCSVTSCSEVQGCTYTATDCDDGNPCTEDYCKKWEGCYGVWSNGLCDDGDPCTQIDSCLGGGCIGYFGCDDEDPCTDDSCGENGCVFVPNTAPCDDGDDATTGDRCMQGVCVGVPPP